MRKTLAALITILATLTIIPNANAAAGCVTNNEYLNTDIGMRMTDVHDMYETDGVQTDSQTIGDVKYQWRHYPHCSSNPNDFVIVEYKNPIGGHNIFRVNWRAIMT